MSGGRLFRDLPLRSTYAFVTTLLLATAARRFYGLTQHSLWSDELWGVIACSQGSWWAMIQNLIIHDSHPPGYQTFLYWWMQLFGSSDIAIRLPSALAGIGAVAFAFELGRRHFSLIVGIIAAAIVGGSFQGIYYSQEARAYAFLMLLAPASANYFIELFVARAPRRFSLHAFLATSTLLMYFHYVGFVFYGGIVILWLLFWVRDGRDHNKLVTDLKILSVPLLLYSPWLPVMYQHMVDAPPSWSTPVPDAQRLSDTFRFLLGPDSPRLYLSLACIAAVLVLRVRRLFDHDKLGITVTYKTYKHRAFACLLWLSLFPLAVFYLKSQWSQSVYTLRHFTYAIPMLAVMSACLPALLIRQVQDRKLRSAGLIAWLLLIFTLDIRANIEHRLHDNYLKEDYRGAVDLVVHDLRFMTMDSKRFVITNQEFFDHYLKQTGLKEHADLYLTQEIQIPVMEAMLKQQGIERFYFLEVGGKEPSPMLRLLEERFEIRCYSHLNKTNAAKFSVRPAKPDRPPISELHDCPLKSTVKSMADD